MEAPFPLPSEGFFPRFALKASPYVAERGEVPIRVIFNPQGKGGDFEETATVVYGTQRKHVELTLQGTCITSEETLLRQFPVRVNDSLRLSTDHFDLGPMRVGETKQRTVVLLHRNDADRQEPITITFTPSADTPKGLQHIAYPLSNEPRIVITLDVLIK